MVRVYGAVFGDVTDRSTRQLGVIYATYGPSGPAAAIQLTESKSVSVEDHPWWAYSPQGRVQFRDDMEGTLQWLQTGGTVTKASDATHVHQGTSALKMVTGAAAGNAAVAQWWGPCPVGKAEISYLQLSFWWQLGAAADATPRDFYFTWLIEDRGLNASYLCGMRFHNYEATVSKRWIEYLNSAGVWTRYGAIFRRTEIVFPCWNYWQLTIKRDPAAGYTYKWFWWDDQTISLAGYATQIGAFAIPHQELVLSTTTDIAAATTAYVDDLELDDELGVSEY